MTPSKRSRLYSLSAIVFALIIYFHDHEFNGCFYYSIACAVVFFLLPLLFKRIDIRLANIILPVVGAICVFLAALIFK